MDAEQLIYDMMIECTGSALCDSGDLYGRGWQMNQSVHPATKKPITFSVCDGRIDYTINVYHALINQDMDCDDITDTFNELNIGSDNWDNDDYYGVSRESGEYLNSVGARPIGDTWNTYNYYSNLSQVLQGCYIDINNMTYVLIQLHNGCDVRGGYTDARLFKLNPYIDYLDLESVYGTCTRDGVDYHISNSYDGYNIRFDDNEPENTDFMDTDIIDLNMLGI